MQEMAKAVKVTLLHCNSKDETPRQHLCPAGEKSWCKSQAAQAKGKEYRHYKVPILEAILHLLKRTCDRLVVQHFSKSVLMATCKMLMNHCTL